jgi:type II secretory pathway pseudopilin PulG
MTCHPQYGGNRKASMGASTIMEVMAAMFIVALLVLAVYGAITSGITTVRMARENLRATQILIEKMEAIRLYHWEQLNSAFIPSTFVVNYDVNNPSTNSGILYQGKVSIEAASTGTTYSDAMKLVTVRIDWSTGHIPRSRELTTFVTRGGLQNYMY